MHKIGGTVQRIDDPAEFGRAGRVSGKKVLFTQDGMLRKCPQNGLLHHLLGGKIGLGHEVGWPFHLDAGLTYQILNSPTGRHGGGLANVKKSRDLGHFLPRGRFPEEARLYEFWREKPQTYDKNSAFLEKIVSDSLQDRETWYHQDRWFWPLLCSGPAVSLPSERRGFYFSSRTSDTIVVCLGGDLSRRARLKPYSTTRLMYVMPSTFWHLDGHTAALSSPAAFACI